MNNLAQTTVHGKCTCVNSALSHTGESSGLRDVESLGVVTSGQSWKDLKGFCILQNGIPTTNPQDELELD